MESQPQKPNKFKNNPENFHPLFKKQIRDCSDLLLNISLAGGQSLK